MNRWQLRWGMVFAVIVLSAQAPTQGAEKLNGGDRREPRFLQEIYAGVVTNQTVSFTGQGFYREFVTHWSDKERADRYSYRHPRAAVGALGQPDLDRVCQSQDIPDLRLARTRRHQVHQRAGGGRAYQNVVEADIQRLLIREPDVGPDEI